MIMDDGYFIIQGVPKVVLIQESKSRSSMFFTLIDKDVMAETKLSGSRNTMRLVYSGEVYIRVLEEGRAKKIHLTDLMSYWDKKGGLENNCLSTAVRFMFERCREAKVMSVLSEDPRGDTDRDLYRYFEDYIAGDSTVCKILCTLLYALSKCISIKLSTCPPTDRDNHGFKVFHSSGHVVSSLIKRAFSKTSGSLEKRIDNDLYSVMKTGTIKINNVRRSKMALQAGTRSTLDMISSVRRVVVPDDNSLSHEMRQIHPSQRGFICPSETPEGKQVGLAKSLAMTCVISPRMDDVHDEILLTSSENPGPWLILNGTVVGTCRPDTYSLIRELKKKYPYLSVNVDDDQDVMVKTWERLPHGLWRNRNHLREGYAIL